MKKTMIMAIIASLFLTQLVFADLSDYIVVVKPLYHEKTQETFKKLAQRFEKDGYKDLASYFTGLAGEHGHGTGWVYVDQDGENYIITNRHVVNQAEKVNIYFVNPDGSQISYNDCPVLYVDDQFDLAICQFPKKNRKYKKGFEVNMAAQKDLTEVVAAGYPGFGGEPVWQIAKGNVSNSQVKLDKNYDFLIQHTAPIDPGNSGGPLLLVDKKAGLGYKVIGVNTWKAGGREATNLAIPVKDVMTCLAKAKDSRKLALDAAEKRTRLLRECKILASEVSSRFPDYNRVYRFISYAMVGEYGLDAFNKVMENVDNKQEWTTRFLDDPVETMRLALFYMFWSDVKSSQNEDLPLEFKEINFTDSEELATRNEIRATFTIRDQVKEIVWIPEQGHWRVRAFEMPAAVKNTSSSKDTKTAKTVKISEPLEKGEFQEGFDTAKLSGWEWVRENASRWNLKGKGTGVLEIAIENGDLYKSTNTARNILLRKTELKDYVVHVKLDFNAVFFGHQAGLIIYGDDDNYVLVYYGSYPDDPGTLTSGRADTLNVGIVSESDGEVNRSVISGYSNTMELWIKKKGDTYAGYAGNEKSGFKRIGEFVNPLGESPKIGLFAYGGANTRKIDYSRTVAAFKDFSVKLKQPKEITVIEEQIAKQAEVDRQKAEVVKKKEEAKRKNFVESYVKLLPAPKQGEFRELFPDANLGSGWSWLNENKSKWSLKDRPGALRIELEKGDLFAENNNARNILLRDPAMKDYMVEVSLDFSPTENYYQAGVIVYLDDDNYVMVYTGCHPQGDDNHSYPPQVKTGLVTESKGKVRITTKSFYKKNCVLRIVKNGDTYTGYIGYVDYIETQFLKIGDFMNKLGASPKVGVFAYRGVDASGEDHRPCQVLADCFRIVPLEE